MMIGNKIFAKKQMSSFTCKFKMMLVTLFLISGCSSYGSSFSCGDSRGANCMPMDRVDKLIASGEIERFTNEKTANCKGFSCKNKASSNIDKEDELPALDQKDFNLKIIED